MSHKYLILGLLAEQPMTGYDIRKHVKDVLGAVTNASYGTLYPTLHKLLSAGEVNMQEVPRRGRPSKKIYATTEKGLQVLDEWLRQPAASDQIKREFLLKLYLAKAIPDHQLLPMLRARRDETEATLKTLADEKQNTHDPRRIWVIDYSLTLALAEIEWLRRLEHTIGLAYGGS